MTGDRIILDDADHPPVEGGVYFIGYCEMVDGYSHAWTETTRSGRTKVRYSRTPSHPPDPRCPECNLPTERNDQ